MITGRCFERDGSIIRQVPEKQSLQPFVAEHGPIKGTLKIQLSLSYLAVCDPGMDRLYCNLCIDRPARWQGSRHEVLVIDREFLRLDAVIDWLLGLEHAILGALFHDCQDDVKDRDIIRVLLAIVDQIRPLAVVLKEDEKTRRKMLE